MRRTIFRRGMKTFGLAAVTAFMLLLLGGQGAPSAYAHGESESVSEMSEEGGLQVTVDGRYLKSPAMMSSDLSEIRVSVREVAEALHFPVKWNAEYRAVLIGDGGIPAELAQMEGASGINHAMTHGSGSANMAGMNVSAIVLNGRVLPSRQERQPGEVGGDGQHRPARSR